MAKGTPKPKATRKTSPATALKNINEFIDGSNLTDESTIGDLKELLKDKIVAQATA